MREIFFRGKRDDNLEWIYGYIYRITENQEMPFLMMKDYHGITYPVYPDTIGQFTGLTDKHGAKIFEGDIVRLDIAGIIFNAVCKFHSGSFGLVWHYMGTDRWQAFTSICHVEYEVIGNIIDTPELMEGE